MSQEAKLTLLILLWILDKLIMFAMFIFFEWKKKNEIQS